MAMSKTDDYSDDGGDADCVECVNCGVPLAESDAAAGPHGHAVHESCPDQ